MSDHNFVTEIFTDEINNIVLPSLFPLLNSLHRELLGKCLIRIVNIIALTYNFNFTNKSTYEHQLRQNSYQDLKWLVMHILPYVNPDGGFNKLTSLRDIYCENVNVNINALEPQYKYSNLQYGRCNRNVDDYRQIPFNEKFLEHNVYLLIDTIKSSANKLLVNWMDIIPHTVTTISDTELYKTTRKALDKFAVTDWDPYLDCSFELSESIACKNVSSKQCGLSVEDIYNTLSVDLYHSVVSIKWLLYDIPCEIDGNEGMCPIASLMHNFFPINIMLNATGTKWDKASEGDREIFSEQFSSLVNAAKRDGFSNVGGVYVSSHSLHILMKGLFMAFNKSYRMIDMAVAEGFIKFDVNDLIEENDDDDDDDHDTRIKVKFSDILPSYESIIDNGLEKHMYEYMRECFQKLKGTWYGHQLMEINDGVESGYKIQLIKPQLNIKIKMDEDFDLVPTLKNTYNFAKSFIHHKQDGNYLPYARVWKSLTPENKKTIIDRLNDHKDGIIGRWFNIGRYIKTSGLLNIVGDSNDISEINQNLYFKIRESLPNVIFESLIYKGVLTKFAPDRNITDMAYTKKDNINKKNKHILTNRNLAKNAYHYLTGMPYKYMDSYATKDDVDKQIKDSGNKYGVKKKNVFEHNSSYPWYNASALDWIAQIGFCHHFIHNRISFITGGTGVGKSTQVPNLFAYYLKALDYTNSGKVVCSQPRKAPTVNNAKIVSQWFGVPIYDYDNVTETDKETENYYIQIKHGDGGDHVDDVTSAPTLKYITDGTLIMEVTDSLMKVKTKSGNYKDDNLYDVIIIDEAHEHNKNMDFLLTFLKLPATYNNSIRIVILSATMDEDEPRYRRYYRDINDNKKYPLDTWIAQHKLDRINVDRRYHISAPGSTTRYVIDEKYYPDMQSAEAVNDIIINSTEGDILVFQPGTGDIAKLVTALNTSLPSDVIALPYHARLNDIQRTFIEKIDENLSSLRIDRTETFEEQVTRAQLQTGTSKYNRCVIVATNIAEASITIPSLKFVVETGTQKNDVYDYRKRGRLLKTNFISESSRLQRKGRVGRKASGTVYYLYEKGKMTNNKTCYNISIVDISFDIYKKLKTNITDVDMITTDPNNPKTVLTLSNLKTLFKKNIDRIIQKQYFIDGVYYSYYGNDEHYDYNHYVIPVKCCDTGYDFDTLIDSNGLFYIIHPDELELQRNICGDVVGIKVTPNSLGGVTFNKTNRYKGLIVSEKVISFIRMLYDYMYLTVGYDNTVKKYAASKTQFGMIVTTLTEKLRESDHGMIRSLLFSIFFECKNDMFILMSIYKVTQYELRTMLITDSQKRYMIDKLKSVVSSTSSDSLCMIELFKDFYAYVQTLNVNTNMSNIKYIQYVISNDNQFKLLPSDYEQLFKPESLTAATKRKIMGDSSKSDLMKLQLAISKQMNIALRDELVYDACTTWCTLRGVNVDTMISCLLTYENMNTNFKKEITSDIITYVASVTEKINRSQLKTVILNNNINTVNLSLLYGYPFNICKRIRGTQFYISMYAPTLTNIYGIASLAFMKFIPSTLLDAIHLSDYILYLKIDIDNDVMHALHTVGDNELKLLSKIFGKDYQEDCDNYANELSLDLVQDNKIDKLVKFVSMISNVINELKANTANTYDSTIVADLKNIWIGDTV
jgi:hypothetical protein